MNADNNAPRAQDALAVAIAGDLIIEIGDRGRCGIKLAASIAKAKGTPSVNENTTWHKSWVEAHGEEAPPLGETRPVRAPHWSTSWSALVGGWAQPGECALAHSGVLIVDEWERMDRRTTRELARATRKGETCARRVHAGEPEEKVRASETMLVLLSPQPPRPGHPRYESIRGEIALRTELTGTEIMEDPHGRIAAARERAMALDGALPQRLDARQRAALKAQMMTPTRKRLERCRPERASLVLKVARACSHLEQSARVRCEDIEQALALGSGKIR